MAEGTRREARERALSLLYEAEARSGDVHEVIATQPLPVADYAEALASGVASEKDRLDGLIARFARSWSLERLAVIDRLVLELAIFELLQREVPTAVVLSEAVELAKRYSTEESGRFVNGVLAAIAAELGS